MSTDAVYGVLVKKVNGAHVGTHLTIWHIRVEFVVPLRTLAKIHRKIIRLFAKRTEYARVLLEALV
jgi:hypothetical protein